MSRYSPATLARNFHSMVTTDTTTTRITTFLHTSTPKLPSATGRYLLDKAPIIEWLPRYHPSWLIQDFLAGLTIGVMLIPQGLAYAKIATIPIENGLYASWLPACFAVIMGTSKELSTGPTSILGLLTADIVKSLSPEYDISAIASAVAFCVGIYSLAMGLLGLGFLLDYVSVPVLSGFISATALIIGFGQVGSLVGLNNTPDGVFNIIGDVLKRLPQWDGPTCGIGFGSIMILWGLEKVGRRWGKRHYLVKYIASSRAIVVLVLFTLISWGVNKDRGNNLLWGISKVSTHGIVKPKTHSPALISKVATRAIAPLVACTLEHLAVGKAFGRRNGYSIDQTQELNYLGVTNIVNSFFSVMPVGGAMSRTAVNSECGVRSPLNGVVTAGFILLTLHVLSPALYWLPKATLAAIIIMAVVHLFGPVSHFYRYWRISLADFIASMLSFWVTIFVSAEVGIGCAAGWSVVWTMLRSAFVKPSVTTSVGDSSSSLPASAAIPGTSAGTVPKATVMESLEKVISNAPSAGHYENVSPSAIAVPSNTVIIRFTDSIFYPNAGRGKRSALENIQLVYAQVSLRNILDVDDRERSWSVASDRRVERLRKQKNIVLKDSPLEVVVWDFGTVPFVDVTAILALGELKDDIRRYAGKAVEIRIVGLTDSVRERFERAQWKLRNCDEGYSAEEGVDVVYPSVEAAVLGRGSARASSELESVVVDADEKTGLEKIFSKA